MTHSSSRPGRPLVPHWFAVMIAASLAVISFGLLAPAPEQDPAPAGIQAERTLVNYIWWDRLPEDPYDKFQIYVFLEDGANRAGINVKGESAFKVLLEVFEFIHTADKIQFSFPHDRRKPTSGYKVEAMKKPVGYFDATLTLDADPQNGGKKTTYYTGEEFKLESTGAALPEHLQPILAQVRSTIQAR